MSQFLREDLRIALERGKTGVFATAGMASDVPFVSVRRFRKILEGPGASTAEPLDIPADCGRAVFSMAAS